MKAEACEYVTHHGTATGEAVSTPIEFKAALKKMTASFDVQEFPYTFLAACGKPQLTIDDLRTGETNKSDLKHEGAVLQERHIHIMGCTKGKVGEAMKALRNSRQTKVMRNKVKFLLASDGHDVCLDEVVSGKTVKTLEFPYQDFPVQVQALFPLAGIGVAKKFTENEVDERAAKKLSELYVELMDKNPDWDRAARRDDIHRFLARIVFCFFAEDTGVFKKKNIFTKNVEAMSKGDVQNTHKVIADIFRDMNNPEYDGDFRYVNGGLFEGSLDVPVFGDKARRILLDIGKLEWTKINPDIFGSMIQTIASSKERSRLGMHYTSVPNILRVLKPLFLDDLEAELNRAGKDKKKLVALQERISQIRVFDPACGSGNFLVIAYKEMRGIESVICKRLGEPKRVSGMHLTNFRGIEYKEFPAMIARLALIIAKFQCDEMYRGHADAVSRLLPLDTDNWITCDNSLRLNWMKVCPPHGLEPTVDDKGELKFKKSDQGAVRFETDGGEVYICGNPPFVSASGPPGGSGGWSDEQSTDMKIVFKEHVIKYGRIDYVAAWLILAAQYIHYAGDAVRVKSAFVSTDSICQGAQVPVFWPSVFNLGCRINFAYTSFKWKNHASDNAQVSVVIIGLSGRSGCGRLFSSKSTGETFMDVDNINPYLVPGENVLIDSSPFPLCGQSTMCVGNHPRDNGGGLRLSPEDLSKMSLSKNEQDSFVRLYVGADEFIKGTTRHCLWIEDKRLDDAVCIPAIRKRLENIRAARLLARRSATIGFAGHPHKFGEGAGAANKTTMVVPVVSTDRRYFLPVGYFSTEVVAASTVRVLLDAPLWNLSLLSSRLHMVWVAVVGGRLGTGLQYSNTICWNTFPIPILTTKNKKDLEARANDILLARASNAPKTIAELYDPDKMPECLRKAHACNDKTIARIYIGKDSFRDDTEMREHLFHRYAKMMKDPATAAKQKNATRSNKPLKDGLFADSKGLSAA